MLLVKKVALAAGALTLAAAGIAAASPSEDADKGLSTAEGRTGKELPVAGEGAPDTEAEAPVADGDEPEDDTTDGGEGGKPDDNHGAVVSAVAQTEFETGREHGKAVSEVARQGHGRPDAETGAHGSDDDEDAAADDADDADDAAGATSNRPAHAGGGRK